MLNVVDGPKSSPLHNYPTARDSLTSKNIQELVPEIQEEKVHRCGLLLIMTLTILVSFSVLALVVTARPILPNDAPQSYAPNFPFCLDLV